MIVPSHLKIVCIPPQRIAEFSDFNRFHKTRQIDDLIRQVAWHETGHAVAWTLNGGTLEQTTIVPDSPQGLWGSTKIFHRSEGV
jgi:hypothetical protein